MDTRPISAVMAIAAYRLPVSREWAPGMGSTALAVSEGAKDRVEISAEARQRAAASTEPQLWGEVRYEYPHTDDPDLPWEVAHQEWTDLMAKVFGSPDEESEAA
ncbi:MAG: hypothetical protein IPI33_01165 [Dehalococcoidia bacterium]|nr:hypothetical protein [Dehalococcoidia bacterium]